MMLQPNHRLLEKIIVSSLLLLFGISNAQGNLVVNGINSVYNSELSATVPYIEAEKLALQLIKQNSRCCTFDSRQSFEIGSQN